MRLKDLKEMVEYFTGIKDISKKKRSREFVYARAAYYLLARKYTRISLNDIGGMVGRDHATVHYALDTLVPTVRGSNDNRIDDIFWDVMDLIENGPKDYAPEKWDPKTLMKVLKKLREEIETVNQNPVLKRVLRLSPEKISILSERLEPILLFLEKDTK